MSNAPIDANSRQGITARLDSDGLTVIRLKANSSTHRLKISDGTLGTALTDSWSAVDENGRGTLFAVSSVDGKTLVALQANSSGQLLINSH